MSFLNLDYRLRLQEASDWAEGVVLPQEAWEDHLYGTFPVVIRGYFAQQRWREALSLLEKDPDLSDEERQAAAERFRSRIDLYQGGQAYTEE